MLRRPGAASSDMPRAGARGHAWSSNGRCAHGSGHQTYPVSVPTRPSQRELDEFLTRGVSDVSVLGDLRSALASGERRLRIKQGFDPTHANLHLGHAISLRKLRKLSHWGHEIVLIVGDWTTQIGDPTDREISKRMKKKTPIPIKDLLYPLLQAYDSVAIKADVEFGGTDQLFNILAGRELQEMLGQPPQSVFIVPMLEGLDGNQMHKSKPATAIWLVDPANEIYGKVMSIDDKLMPHYFEW